MLQQIYSNRQLHSVNHSKQLSYGRETARRLLRFRLTFSLYVYNHGSSGDVKIVQHSALSSTTVLYTSWVPHGQYRRKTPLDRAYIRQLNSPLFAVVRDQFDYCNDLMERIIKAAVSVNYRCLVNQRRPRCGPCDVAKYCEYRSKTQQRLMNWAQPTYVSVELTGRRSSYNHQPRRLSYNGRPTTRSH